jgi:tRNA pseudouridine13 synthase
MVNIGLKNLEAPSKRSMMQTSSPARAKDLAVQLKQSMADLPYFSSDLPGTGGVLKSEPAHFEVEEILPYAPCGEGEHVYVTARRSGWNTVDVAAALAKRFDLKPMQIGWGGRKDKHAVTTQTFSLTLPLGLDLVEIQAKLRGLPFEILGLSRHRNKIKTGHVAGNRFRILLCEVPPQAFSHAQDICRVLLERGIPNFYGEQRFGHRLGNIDDAAHLLGYDRPANDPANKRLRCRRSTFIISALQSALFNFWLKSRINRGDALRIMTGDLVQKRDTGGLFHAQDVDEVQARFQKHDVVYTGPIFGYKMMTAKARAAEYENQVLETLGLAPQVFKSFRAAGSRRPALIFLDDLRISRRENGLRFDFTLPSGAYATTVMREFTRSPF